MTTDDAERIAKAAADNDLEVHIHYGYSGRGMFGKSTTGLLGSKTDIVWAMQHANLPTANLRWDKMGFDYIAY